MTTELLSDLEVAVWRELGKRGWFGKHVEEEEMSLLEIDLRRALKEALDTDATRTSAPIHESE